MRSECQFVVWLTCLVLLPASGVLAQCGGYDKPCESPLNLGQIDSIVVSGSWVQDDEADEAASHCKRQPQLTTDDVRRYFERAGRIDGSVATNGITVSSCRIRGELRISNGTRVEWNLGIYRDGYVMMPDTYGQQERVDVYCGQCDAPFRKAVQP